MTFFELVKMCVSPALRAQGLGYQLGLAILKLARKIGTSSVYLESNDMLKPALHRTENLVSGT